MDCSNKILNVSGIELTKQMQQQFTRYYELLTEWNQVMNLTAITEFDEVMEKHFLDSIILGNYIDLTGNLSVVDVGTGAGFPGIPLKIVFPNLRLVLLDSLNKRVKFLDAVIKSLGLNGITAVHGRAEDLARQSQYRENFDLCVSRAVANLSSLSEYCLPFVKLNGYFVSYKSGEVEEETGKAQRAIELLGGSLENVHKFCLPGTDYQRSFVCIAKKNNTSKRYPRKAGTPSREPLS